MAELINQKRLRLTDKNKTNEMPAFITEDVVEVKRAKLTYYKWISHFMIFLTTLALIYGVCLTLAILKLVPNIMVEPLIVVKDMSDSRSLSKREYINYYMESREKIMINFMKQYIELRHTFLKDESEMQKRWLWGGLVSYLSTYAVYKKFAEEYPKVTEELVNNNASRSVEIISVQRNKSKTENKYESVWVAHFKTYDFTFQEDDYSRKNIEPKITETYWVASITCKIDVNRRTAYRRLINPLGFVVTNYSVSEMKLK